MNGLRISVVGLGKLGACMAAATAERGHQVIGIDLHAPFVDAINRGEAPVQEPGLAEMIANNRERLRATTDYEVAVAASDLTFVVVPTPSDDRGAFSLEYATQAFAALGRALRNKLTYHLVVLTSTVLPGSTRYRLITELEAASGKQCGPDFGVCYSPEFIALGSVIRDYLNPDFTLIGEFDEQSGALLEAAYARIVMNSAPSRRMSIENAELTKIALNSYVTTKITFANMLADLCERIPGGDVDVVSDALGMDKRIGRRYLTGGVAYGGPCFPRDNIALAFLANSLGIEPLLPQATDTLNQRAADKVVERLVPLAREGSTIGVLGLAYKPFTNVVEESAGVHIARELAKAGARVIGYDALAAENASRVLGESVQTTADLVGCIEHCDVLVITTPDPPFRTLNLDARLERPVRVVDCWRILDPELRTATHVQYEAIGRSLDDVADMQRLKDIWN